MPSGISQQHSYFILLSDSYLVISGINDYAEMMELEVQFLADTPVCQLGLAQLNAKNNAKSSPFHSFG